MNSVLDIASRISTPLALAGLFAAVLFFIFRRILSLPIFARLARKHTAEIVTHILRSLFILALVAMLLGFAGYVLTVLTDHRIKESTGSREYQDALFAASQELRSDREYMAVVCGYIRAERALRPFGSIRTDKTRALLDAHYDHVTRNAYGEEKYIYQLVLELDSIGRALSSLQTLDDFKRWDNTYEMALDDVLFLTGFLWWYFACVAKDDLEGNQAYALGWNATSDVFVSEQFANELDMRYFVDEAGKPILEYSDYLGMID